MGFLVKGKRRLGIVVGHEAPPSRTIEFQPPGNLDVPVGLYVVGSCHRGEFVRLRGFSEWRITERTAGGVFEQDRAALRAYVNHLYVLRRGRPGDWEREYRSTNADGGDAGSEDDVRCLKFGVRVSLGFFPPPCAARSGPQSFIAAYSSQFSF